MLSRVSDEVPAARIAFLISCEHGGSRIPSRYRELFLAHQPLLRTHRGSDFGALRMAREMAAAFDAPLFASTVSRLLVDLNRSLRHPALWSEASRAAAPAVREEILRRYYLPYRGKLESTAGQWVAAGRRVIHISCHSFTPELNGEVRNADIGLLYDPSRAAEARLCRLWRDDLAARAPSMRVRMNYPYAGTSDGFTTHLRRQFAGDRYLGIELEINQRHVLAGGAHWQGLRASVIGALGDAAARFATMAGSSTGP